MGKFIKEEKILLLEIVIICIIVLPILAISFYALPAADDFSNTNRMGMLLIEEHSYLKVALSEVWSYYKSTSGYFFSAFLNFFLSPFLRGGITALRGTVFTINLFFYLSLYVFVDKISKFLGDKIDRRKCLYIYIIALMAFTNNYNNVETWTWYCVLIAYVFVVACVFWGVAFFIQALQNDKFYYIIASSVIGFMASGASLNVTALNCGLYLIIGIIGFRKYNKKKISIICFSSALAGGIINAVAPGNFIRHDITTTSYSIMGSLKSALILGISRVQMLLVYSPFVLLLVLFFIFSLKNINYSGKEWKIHPFIILLVVFVGIVMVNFPVCLGYATTSMPYRCIWVEDCAIYIGVFGWSGYLAGWLKGKLGEFIISKECFLCLVLCCLLFSCSLGGIRSIESYPTIQMIRQLINGEIEEYAEFWEGIFEEIELSENKDVAVYREVMKENDFITSPGMWGDKSNWINRSIASYYGKDSAYIVIG